MSAQAVSRPPRRRPLRLRQRRRRPRRRRRSPQHQPRQRRRPRWWCPARAARRARCGKHERSKPCQSGAGGVSGGGGASSQACSRGRSSSIASGQACGGGRSSGSGSGRVWPQEPVCGERRRGKTGRGVASAVSYFMRNNEAFYGLARANAAPSAQPSDFSRAHSACPAY